MILCLCSGVVPGYSFSYSDTKPAFPPWSWLRMCASSCLGSGETTASEEARWKYSCPDESLLLRGLPGSTPSTSCGKTDWKQPSIWSKEWFSNISTITWRIGSALAVLVVLRNQERIALSQSSTTVPSPQPPIQTCGAASC